MKQIKLLPLSFMLIICFASTAAAQIQTLPGITLLARNYKYLRAVDNKEVAQPVKLLERKAAMYDIKNSEYYHDDYESYDISFYLPQGYILAVYDSTGKLLSTAEKFKNVGLPAAVRNAVAERFPNWAISNDTYQVNFKTDGETKMQYKLVLANGTKRVRVKVDEKGKILD